MKMADAVKFLGLPSSKGYGTPEYLGMIIDKVEQLDYRFIQFLQLVDILYVIFDRRTQQIKQVQLRTQGFSPKEEIDRHYGNRDTEDVQKYINKDHRVHEKRHDEVSETMESSKSDIIQDTNSTFGNHQMPWNLNK